MKQSMRCAFFCAIVLSMVSLVGAQQVPTPVVRIGDWVEIGNEVFMNIIATTDIRYRTVKDYDFEHRIQDRVNTRHNLGTSPMGGELDGMWEESRLGVDMRYQKSLQLQVLFEHQSIMDGNLIDNPSGTSPGCGSAGSPPCRPGFAGPSDERNTVNLERFWIDYKFYGTRFRMRVGSDLWRTDLAGIIADDDPRFALFYDGDPFSAYAAMVMEQSASRLGLTNDNSFIYYTFGGAFQSKPHLLKLDMVYFRERFTGATGQPVAQYGQKHDTVMISPSWQGSFGPINTMVQGSFVVGTARGASLAGDPDLDVWAWSAIGYMEVDLGAVKPFIAVLYGSGDGDAGDDDLNGFAPTPLGNITLLSGHPFFNTMDTSASWGTRGPAAPARAGFAGGVEFRHTVGSPYSDRIGRAAHRNAAGALVINSAYSNPGILMPMAGIKTTLAKGHALDLWWIWTLLDQTDILRAAALQAGVSPELARFDRSMMHEFGIVYFWTLNPHFDIRFAGGIMIPQAGAKDIARTQDCDANTPGLQTCEGEDVALRGELRFRARF